MRLFVACCGKRRKAIIEELVFALGCHSVIYPQNLICDVLAHSREQNRCGSVLWALVA